MQIHVNETTVVEEESISLADIVRRYKPDADILVYNGMPVSMQQAQSMPVQDEDHVVLIKRGQLPKRHELEALMVARHSPGVHQRLKEATVGIAGAGGLGSHAALALARVGIGTLLIVDYDIVEPSNLNRQAFTVDQIGKAKVEALQHNIAAANPFVRVRCHQIRITGKNVASLFAGIDVLVEALDAAEEKVMLVNAFSQEFPDTPVVMASGVAGYASSNWIKTQRLGKALYVVGDLQSAATVGQGLMAPRVGIAAHHQANQAVRTILGQADEDESAEGDR